MTQFGKAFGFILLAGAASLLLGANPTFALEPKLKPELPNFDQRMEDNLDAAFPTSDQTLALTELKSVIPDVRVDFDELLGSPAWITSARGFLTGSNGVGLAVSPGTLENFPGADPYRITKAFLADHSALFGHGPEALLLAAVKREYDTTHNGLHTVVWEQQLDGIPVFEALLISHLTRNAELVSIASHFVANPDDAANESAPDRATLESNPTVSAVQALAYAAQNIGETPVLGQIAASTPPQGPDKHQKFKTPCLQGEADTHLVWFPTAPNSLRLSWEVILMSRARGEMFRVLIDAETGEVLLRHGLTENISTASYRVYTSQSPTPLSPGYPTPSTNQPPEIARVLVVTNAFDTNASPNGWINDGDNETLGNNVDAYLDRNGDEQSDLGHPRGAPFRVFDFPLDLTADPITYSNACVVNLFYWSNWMHDHLYELGFTEAAGNFQVDNFQRGGLGNDPVKAEAQDGSGYNNASFSTPPDGNSGRMQMFLWTGPFPNRDADFDTEVILHEYTHGLSSRRVGGGIGISLLQSRGMAEGWSDFYSLALTSQPGDDLNATYPEGPYASYQLSGLAQNYYFGIRRYPYSTDLTKAPGTFKDIDPTQADSHPGIPVNPVIPNTASEIHNQGEIWGAALWDARAAIIGKYGFTNGNQLILQLVTDGMNFCPANPTFLQARDAIIQADLVDTGGANYHDLWSAFAKRGMGIFATAPPSSTTTGVVESYVVPDDLLVTPATDFISEGTIGGPFSPNSQSYVLKNTGTNTLDWAVFITTPWLTLSLTNGTLPPGGGSTNVLISLATSTTNLSIGNYSAIIILSNLTSGSSQTRNVALTISPPLIYSFSLDADPGWTRQGEWAFGQPGGLGGSPHGNPDPSSGATGTNVFGVNLNGNYSTAVGGPYFLTAGPFDFTGFGNISLQFQRWLNTDYPPYAYATVEVSNDGANWSLIFTNRTSAIQDSSWTECQYDISAFADGQPSVFVRWGYSVNYGAFPYSGWNIDDVAFFGTSGLSVSLPASATEGDGVLPAEARVSIANPFWSDLVISLATSDPTKLTVPATVTIPAGQTNATFDLTVIDNSVLDGTELVSVTASAPNYASGSASIPVFDNETATLFLSLPTDANEGDAVVQGVVTTSLSPVNDIPIALASSDPATLQVPLTVIMPAGQTSAVFFATITDDAKINGTRPVTVTAHVMNWIDGLFVIAIHDNENTNLVLTLPAQARESNGLLPNAGRVQISGTLPSDLIISLACDNTNKLLVPPAATILAGQTSAVFTLATVAGNPPQNPLPVTVTASASGFSNAAAAINIIDNGTPPAPFNPLPPDQSTNNPVIVTLSWSPGIGEGVEQLANGGFESGDFSAWITSPAGNAGFVINDGTILPPSADTPALPFAGKFSALAQQTPPAISLLYQDIILPTNAGIITLAWADRIRNFSYTFATNQQFRIEVRDTNDTVLAVPFTTKPGDSLLNAWAQRSTDLSSFAGQSIRVAFIVNAGISFLDVHLDEISIRASTLPPATYDVYFGNNPIPGLPEFLGNTTNTFWSLPQLTALTNYYWQIVANRQNQTPGPVWLFSTLPTLFIDPTSIEATSVVTNAIFNVRLSDPASQPVTVNFTSTDGTAVAPSDYTATNGTLIFNPGETNQSIAVAISPNFGGPITNKIFLINLSNPSYSALGTNQAIGTIIDDIVAVTPPVITSIQVNGLQVSLTWTAIAGRTYRVQYKTNILADWTDFPGDIPATSPTAGKTDPSALDLQRFYRVILLP
ncbi:MAG: hypothetical protein JWR26_684 [Pedosphaera sp.]|nr:hypothetical protein [Pedosphaera sp.]